MEDFDVFTNKIDYSGPAFKNILNRFVRDIPCIPSGPNYESGQKLLAEESLAEGLEKKCAFYFSESVSASVRTLAVYRDEQNSGTTLSKITNSIKHVKNVIEANPTTKEEEDLLQTLSFDLKATEILDQYEVCDELPFYKKYMRFSSENNVNNFLKILEELPKEWTIIQLTSQYNPNENLKPLREYMTEISSIYITVLSNDYSDHLEYGPLTVETLANVTKGEEKPLFEELYSLLDENYNIIDKAQFLNNKRLIRNYWSRREDVDLRIQSVINVMHKEWLGGWSSLLTGKLIDSSLRDKVVDHVDRALSDWGFMKLTTKQKILLYNLLESSLSLPIQVIKSCIRKILTHHGDPDDVRRVLTDCESCSKEFRFLNQLCSYCLSACFEKIHHFSLMDSVKALAEIATQMKDNDKWQVLKEAKRHPVILIVDELLDTFPWETLPILNLQPVTRIENIHFLYALYKEHQDKIIDGYFGAKSDVGKYVINPEKNLERMELRMSSFVKYWCDTWTGHIGEAPPPEDYLTYLSSSDIFLYCGHGDGCQYAKGAGNGAGVEGALGTRTAALLSGCGSVRLNRTHGRVPPSGAHHHFHIASCPIVIGMLWEVTDLEVDKVVSTLVSLYVPSAAPVDWKSVGKAKWNQGIIETNVEPKSQFAPERNLLLAMSRARGSTTITMIASSLVARGLPVRILERFMHFTR